MKIRAIILFGVLFSVATLDTSAQQLFRRTQYMFNSYLINPAVAGTNVNTPIMASYRQQWAGFSNAPTTMTFSGHTNLPNALGAGLIVFNDDAGGAISRTGAELTGVYKVDLNNQDQVSFGLSAVVSNFQFDNSSLQVVDLNDPNLLTDMEQTMNFDANFGMMVYADNYFYGFSVYQLFQSKLGVETVSPLIKNQNRRHFNVMGSYDYEVTEEFTFQPSGLLRFTGFTPVQFDVHMKGIYMDTFWIGISYRHQDAMATSLGLKLGNLRIGYAYDVTTTSAVRELSPHTHEICLGYEIPRLDPEFKKKAGITKRRYKKVKIK